MKIGRLTPEMRTLLGGMVLRQVPSLLRFTFLTVVAFHQVGLAWWHWACLGFLLLGYHCQRLMAQEAQRNFLMADEAVTKLKHFIDDDMKSFIEEHNRLHHPEKVRAAAGAPGKN